MKEFYAEGKRLKEMLVRKQIDNGIGVFSREDTRTLREVLLENKKKFVKIILKVDLNELTLVEDNTGIEIFNTIPETLLHYKVCAVLEYTGYIRIVIDMKEGWNHE